ncbi:alpha/beta hydrolase domain-containing protein VTE7-like [Apium graveolens]|uniref:alpha/beta hydrolase domain-containing protein VTE7-like n=1 Tax=Apium graveolens TaxID=4045 RepID=UPI003D78DC61
MLVMVPPTGGIAPPASKHLLTGRRRVEVVSVADSSISFPWFIPKEVEKVKDIHARKMASRMQRLPVQLSGLNRPIMSSCVRPLVHAKTNPLVLLHGFDSSCLEWRYTLPLLEDANLETWAVDILGWGFSDLESRPACTVDSKRDHLYQFWKSYIKRPMILVGPSLGAAVAIDFAVNHPEAVEKLILIDASVYAEGTGNLAKLPKAVAYAGAYFLKSVLLRFYATNLTFNGIPFDTCLDWAHIGRLHCLLPWWVDTTVDFINSGGYNIRKLIKQVKHETLIIWGEDDQIIDNKLAVRLHCDLANAVLRQVPDCGHIPHVEKPYEAAKLIMEFVKAECHVLTR